MSSYLRVLRHTNFRYLFLGQAASVVGDRVVFVALALFVTQQTGSPTDLGFVLGAQALPLVGLVLLGGVWADRLPRHRIMVVTDLTRKREQAVFGEIMSRLTAELMKNHSASEVRAFTEFMERAAELATGYAAELAEGISTE